MTESDFTPYHYFHIEFILDDGLELSGVFVDPMNHHKTSKPCTVYDFTPTINMIAWKQAKQNGDKAKMKELQGEIDILKIVLVQRL
jgi:hypothetical protein